MLKIGITGGIGSGKSWVCKQFTLLGIPVFNADQAARYLMENDETLIEQLQLHFGKETFKNGLLDRPFLSSIVFHSPDKLALLNSLVHPATIAYAAEWYLQQSSPYVVKEAAIFFESRTNVDMDFMVEIYAPKSLRIERTMLRDKISKEAVLARMSKQMDEKEKLGRCDFMIVNDGSDPVEEQVRHLHKYLLNYIAEQQKQ